MDCTPNVAWKMSSSSPRSSMFSPMLSFKSFTVLHFIFRSVIHLELILMKSIGLSLESFVLCGCSFAEKTIFAPLFPLYFFVKEQLTYLWGSISPALSLGLYSVPLIYLFVFSFIFCHYHNWPDYCSLIIYLKVW